MPNRPENLLNDEQANAIAHKVYIWITSQSFSDAYGWSEFHADLMPGSDDPWLDAHIRGDEGCLSQDEVIAKIRKRLLI